MPVFMAVLVAAASTRVERVVYVGTYTGEASKGIYAFRFDDSSGRLIPLGLAAETPSPSFLTASTDGRFVFAVNELESFQGKPSGSVTSFTVDAASAKLAQVSVQPSMGAGPCHLALDRTGRYLAVANYGGGNYSLFPVLADGRLQPATSVVSGASADSPKPMGHMVGFDAGNRFLIAADYGLDRMLVYRFDASTGAISATPPSATALPTGSGPRHFALHPNRRWVFTINEVSATITTFAWHRIGRPRGRGQRADTTRRCHGRIDRRDRRSPQRPFRVRIESRATWGGIRGRRRADVARWGGGQHRGLQRRRRWRADPRRVRANARRAAAELRHRSNRALAHCGQPGIEHARRVQHRSNNGRALARGIPRQRWVAGQRVDHVDSRLRRSWDSAVRPRESRAFGPPRIGASRLVGKCTCVFPRTK